jgi:hypothetical protein
MVVICWSLTSIIQPLDITISQPFKESLRRFYGEWMAEVNHRYTAGGKIKRPHLETMFWWKLRVWDCISSDVKMISFKMAGIFNALDGTEADVIWQEAEIGYNDVNESSASESESCLSSDDENWKLCKT